MTARMFASLGQQFLVAADLLAELVVLLEDLVAFEGGELAELQADDRLGLGLGHAVARLRAEFALQGREVLVAEGPLHHGGGDGHALQPLLRLGPARRRAADADHLVERRDGDELPFEDVAAPLRLAQQVLGAPADHLHAVAQELLASSP